MTLQPEDQLGDYEILGAVGAGGMGEVSRARDTRLGREVAIKVLPTDLADDPMLLDRLEREARSLAAVNHPGIATLFGLHEAQTNGRTVRLLAMELIEGEDIAQRLQRNGALAIEEALALARQIAAALEGREERLSMEPSPFTHATLSPSNRHIAAEVTKPATGSDLWVYPVDLTGGRILPTVLASGGVNRNPVWSHDGESVYFASDRSGTFDIWRRRADASEGPEVVVERIGDQVPADISPDGRWLYFTEESPGDRDLYRVSLEPGSEPETVLATDHDEGNPSLSPDGTHLAFETDATGDFRVVVLQLATGRPSSVQRGFFPDWAPNGSRIFYFDGYNANRVVWADVETEPEIAIREVVGGSVEAQVSSSFQIDVTREGDRVLMAVPVQREEEGAPGPGATGPKSRIHVVVNWFEELEVALPTDG